MTDHDPVSQKPDTPESLPENSRGVSHTQMKMYAAAACFYGGWLAAVLTWGTGWAALAISVGLLGLFWIATLYCRECGLWVFLRNGGDTEILWPWFFIIPDHCSRCGHRHD